MKHAKIILLPEAYQVQLLIDTINMYSDLCNYISKVVHRIYSAIPFNASNLELVKNNKELHNKVHCEYPDLNINYIHLAIRKVTKFYRYRDILKDAYIFSGILDGNSYLITIKSILKSSNSLGMLTISTLAGPQEMNFTFDDAKKEELYNAFNDYTGHEYELYYKYDKFYLSTLIKTNKIKPLINNQWQDPFRKGNRYL